MSDYTGGSKESYSCSNVICKSDKDIEPNMEPTVSRSITLFEELIELTHKNLNDLESHISPVLEYRGDEPMAENAKAVSQSCEIVGRLNISYDSLASLNNRICQITDRARV